MKQIFLFILAFTYAMPLFADGKTQGEDVVLENWGVTDYAEDASKFPKCQGTAAEAGLPTDNSNTEAAWARKMKDYVGYGAEYYIAHDINNNGAKFCKTVIGGNRNGCTGFPYTKYYGAKVSDCFWLCKDGYYGEKCSCQETDNGSETSCNPYDDYSTSPASYAAKKSGAGTVKLEPGLIQGADIDSAIDKFYAGGQFICNFKRHVGGSFANFTSEKKQEHDIVLAIYEINAGDDYVVFDVRPMVYRAGGTVWCGASASSTWPMVSWINNASHKLCPFDYARTDDDRCVHPAQLQAEEDKAKNETMKRVMKAHFCADYPESEYVASVHEMYTKCEDPDDCKTYTAGSTDYDWTGKCIKYRCKSSVMGFKSDWRVSGDLGCYECTGEQGRFGINAEGVCEQCEIGKIFDTNKQECVEAKTFTKNDMRYGKGNQPSTALAQQCWIQDNPTCYKCCLTGDTLPSEADCKACSGGISGASGQ